MNLQPLLTPAKPASRETAPLVSADGVSLMLGGQLVLDAVSLTVSPGEIVTLIGPNGAGKSSLARVLLGLVEPTRGKVSRRAGLSVGYVPQRFAVPETIPLTVRRLLTLTRKAGEAADPRAISGLPVLYSIANHAVDHYPAAIALPTGRWRASALGPAS